MQDVLPIINLASDILVMAAALTSLVETALRRRSHRKNQ
jgi:hypothetical protein